MCPSCDLTPIQSIDIYPVVLPVAYIYFVSRFPVEQVLVCLMRMMNGTPSVVQIACILANASLDVFTESGAKTHTFKKRIFGAK